MQTALVYARVSTKQQREDGSSLESQVERSLELAKARGYEVPAGYIFEEDWPGNELSRPELNQARDLVRRQAVSALVVYSTDRLSRKPVHIALIAEECQKHSVDLIFVTEPLDTSPEGMLICYVRGFAAELEREKIRERTIRGKLARAQRGKLPQGTGRGMYAYQYDAQSGTRVVVEAEAEVVRRMFRLASEGHSAHRIAAILNADRIPNFSGREWHSQTIGSMLRNSSYCGRTQYGKTRRVPLEGKRRRLQPGDPEKVLEIPGASPAIVSDEEFAEAQQALAVTKRPVRPAQSYLLTGHIVCGLCGGPMSGSMLNHRYRYYDCRRRWDRRAQRTVCSARYVRAFPLEEAVLDKLKAVIEDPQIIVAEVRRMQAEGEPADLAGELKRIDGQVKGQLDWERRMVRLYGMGEIDDEFIVQETRNSKATRRRLEEEKKQLEVQKRRMAELEHAGDAADAFCQRVRERLGHLDYDGKRLLLAALQTRVVVQPDQIYVHGIIPSYATIERTSGWLPAGRIDSQETGVPFVLPAAVIY